MTTCGTSLKIQNLTTSASLIFVGQCCVFKYRWNTMSSEGGGFFNQFTLWGEGGEVSLGVTMAVARAGLLESRM